MDNKLKLPVGIENFEEIRKSGFYYIDKTRLIEQLLQNWGKVNLFTRPRRFGKTLNMSMLKSFFEIGTDSSLFEGLYISNNTELCNEYMGKYPVIFLSLKGVDGLTFSKSKEMLSEIIKEEADRHYYLKNSEKLTQEDRISFQSILTGTDENIENSLKTLSRFLYKHYDRKTIIIIDEYDVPLDKAFQNGYYKEMVALIKGIFGQALKTNDFLQFAILTGCLRISKESIFTGLNNFEVLSILNVQYDECFGFTDAEVRKILKDYGLSAHYADMKEWYDGYRFGNTDIYCPWDVIRYSKSLCMDEEAKPEDFWSNSSGNAIVRRFIDKADASTKNEIERLIAGEYIEKEISQELTYEELDDKIENLWSVLFTTGYLTQVECVGNHIYQLVIPNKEVREVFVLQIREWFDRVIENNQASTEKINRGFLEGKTDDIQKELTLLLGETISILDTKSRNEEKEIFYHGILLGILKNHAGWAVKSNKESGDGFADILIKPKNPDTGIIIELKYARTFDELGQTCARALQQIKDRRYDEDLRADGRREILAYGIAFCKKRCRVVVERL